MKDADFRGKHKLPPINDIICGTAVIMKRACGKKGCHCLQGYAHKSLYISQYYKGAGRMVYIPKVNEEKVLRLLKNYQLLKSAMRKASELNMGRFTAGSKRGRA